MSSKRGCDAPRLQPLRRCGFVPGEGAGAAAFAAGSASPPPPPAAAAAAAAAAGAAAPTPHTDSKITAAGRDCGPSWFRSGAGSGGDHQCYALSARGVPPCPVTGADRAAAACGEWLLLWVWDVPGDADAGGGGGGAVDGAVVDVGDDGGGIGRGWDRSQFDPNEGDATTLAAGCDGAATAAGAAYAAGANGGGGDADGAWSRQMGARLQSAVLLPHTSMQVAALPEEAAAVLGTGVSAADFDDAKDVGGASGGGGGGAAASSRSRRAEFVDNLERCAALRQTMLSGQGVVVAVGNNQGSPLLVDLTPEPADVGPAGVAAWLEGSGPRLRTALTSGRVDPMRPMAVWMRGKGHEKGMRALAASPCGRWVGSGGRDECVAIWSLEELRMLHFDKSHQASVLGMAFTTVPANAGSDSVIAAAEKAAHVHRDDYRAIAEATTAACDSKRIDVMISACLGRVITITRCDTGEKLAKLNSSHTLTIWDMDVVEPHWFVTASADNSTKVWSLATFKELHHDETHEKWATGITATFSGHSCVSVGNTGRVLVQDLRTSEFLGLGRIAGTSWSCVDCTPNRIVLGGNDPVLYDIPYRSAPTLTKSAAKR